MTIKLFIIMASCTQYFSVEITLMLFLFSQYLLESLSTNLFIYRTCYAILGYNESDCAQLGKVENNVTIALEPLVQPTVNQISMTIRVIHTSIPSILCMFIGTLSDKFGRKPFLIFVLTGVLISTILGGVITYFPQISPWFFVLSIIPTVFTGGYTTVFVLITVYITDITTPETRVIRMGLYEALNAVGSLLGNVSSSYLLYATSYFSVYTISAGLLGLAMLYTIVIIPESLKIKKNVHKWSKIREVLQFNDILKTTFQKRKKNRRAFILVIMALMFAQVFQSTGEHSVKTLFLRKKLHWTLQKITLANSFSSITFIVGTIFGTVVLYKKLKLSERQLITLAVLSGAVGHLLRGIATNDYYIYAAYLVSSFSGLTSTMLRTLLSCLVSTDEVGKIYATLNTIDAVGNTIASLIYPFIYNATLEIDSGIYNFINSGILLLLGVVNIYFMRFEIPVLNNKTKEPSHDNIIGKRLSKKLSTVSEISQIAVELGFKTY